MRALKLAFGAFCLALMLGISGPGQAQFGGGEKKDLFKLQLCNKFTAAVRVSLIHRTAPGENRFVVRGWFGIEQDKCVEGDLPHGPFAIFVYSDSAQKAWGGNLRACVNPGANFETILAPNSRCKQGEVLVGFAPFDAPTEPEVGIGTE